LDTEEYIKQLEDVIKQMLRPLKDIPFRVVIKSLSGKNIIPVNMENPEDKELVNLLSNIAEAAGKAVNLTGIKRSRPNEVGNDIEKYIKDALTNAGFTASVPSTKRGRKQTMGYPDIEFVDRTGRPVYLECKTYNIKNISTTQRSFFLSPSEYFKVTRDGFHFILSYQVYVDNDKGDNNIYKVKHWKLVNIEQLKVDVKHEFNSDNKRLYLSEFLLNEGDI
jgi:hypothetical protein